MAWRLAEIFTLVRTTAKTQVEEAVRARLTIEKEALLLRAANENYSQQVEALTAQVADLEEAIQEATAQGTLATQQLHEVRHEHGRLCSRVIGARKTLVGC
jgi:DNA-binding GntR family transcriptional regulator